MKSQVLILLGLLLFALIQHYWFYQFWIVYGTVAIGGLIILMSVGVLKMIRKNKEIPKTDDRE